MTYDNDGDMPGDTGGSLGAHAFQSAPDIAPVVVSQAWRGADPSAINRDINNGPDLDAVPDPDDAMPTNMTTGGDL